MKSSSAKSISLVELRLKIPEELKNNLKDLAEAKGMPVNRLGTFLINELLNQKPDLSTAMKTSIQYGCLEQAILPAYHELFSSYSLLVAAWSTQDNGDFLGKCQLFKESADRFVEIFNSE